MKKNVTLGEVKQAKKLAENKISEAIVEFEITTGFRINDSYKLVILEIKNPF